MENLVRKKMKGFRFEPTSGCSYVDSMDKHIGEIGVITKQDKETIRVKFKEDWWNYPLPKALEHIIQDKPIIPELGEGVLMEVSHDGENWFNQYIIAKYKEKYISNILASYTHARPIQPKKLTMEELEELVGGKFEIVNK